MPAAQAALQPPSFNLANELDAALRQAATTALRDEPTQPKDELTTGALQEGKESQPPTLEGANEFCPELRPADPRHGDFQANGVLPYAKARKQNPRALAEKLVAALPDSLRERFDIAIAGPGFINFTARPAALLDWLAHYDSGARLREGAASTHGGERTIVDYSSPNTAKQLHVGHIRSMVIGEAICRLLEFCGAQVIRDNHIGDWGTQFGKLIWGYKTLLDAEALARDPLEELERLYKAADAATKADPAILDAARAELVKLQSGDAENLALWRQINATSSTAFQQIYQQLDIRFDHELGESFYNDKLARIYTELQDCGLATESQGALVVFHPEHPRFAKQPFIVRKSDGASNYATTDLATMLYRTEHFEADTIIILTDTRQTDHFEQLWLTTQKWYAAKGYRLPEFEHVSFGAILGDDGRAIKTRTGDPIRLQALLDEGIERAYALVSEKSPTLPETDRREIAAAVGLGAVRYADLSQNRSSDYVFKWEKILSFDGNTAPYLLYAVTRIHSIFRKLGLDPYTNTASAATAAGAASAPETEHELALARKLLQLPAVLQTTTEQLRPHFLCTYLFELAGTFSSFYAAEKVLNDSPGIQARRLLLCARTLLFLETGLHLLGLKTLTRM
ncbi:arginine--tRNA ligase [Cephaloticoccus capnophilus]|uniref:Arginine--tRNA ligase n=1 Tax=Cephaloticoccus capnophilus TaxID=1548208 RepID=A0A139SR89_9BACT|nr:arginine--tRNA ligase [Cephaloticoccus capnophilus]KXU37024.1 arginine--tRNA ligase [Cephaloticoccus capnophilus]